VEDEPPQPPTPTSVTSLKRKADEMTTDCEFSAEAERAESLQLHIEVADSPEPPRQRQRIEEPAQPARDRRVLKYAAVAALSSISTAIGTVIALASIPDGFFP
jgi:hypothetical protein